MDTSGFAVGFHAAGSVDGVAPEIVSELGSADDAGNDGTAMEADTDGDVETFALTQDADGIESIDGEAQGAVGMIGSDSRKSGDSHVGIADGLDLFKSVHGSKTIEFGEEDVEDVHEW